MGELVSTPRPYRSRLRAEQAEQTRLRIRQAARELFERQGFADTTIAQIAEAAGVAVPTVYATYRSKGGVVGAMLEDLEEAADQAGWEAADPGRDRPDPTAPPVRDVDPDAVRVRRAGRARRDGCAQRSRRGSDDGAGGCEPARRHDGARCALEGVRRARPGLEALEAAQTLWLMTSAEQFLLATDELGWSPADYERWLASAAHQLILRAGAESTGPSHR
jgi:AcrR family transcriptional regulator